MNKTVDDILKEKIAPVVAIDEHGLFFYLNEAFENAYGWKQEDLMGKLITLIMPPHMRDAHNFGFSRFLTTEVSKIQGIPLRLPIQCKDGTVLEAEHFIVGEKKDGKWRFAATIKSNNFK
ncbi:MAG TPA: PAS domain S-box protein [Candidatus Nitrosocosmicus sp.]|nr:PAS domain S-box protein [Candidatus Nitrosocosmicus sp.]